eukprot:CAMPEP_0168330764 /NCGR_PEP_ID=MMETSP0213-20121227/7933_1 /TAXON_ID=151035 /ORGANISM="Euplotes harpa, Strain FSP1.4" /LENGTH=84 /DNA_ID=CAMNT_0008334413 /DNA_START=391 /DNA_END=646 /DNA_ORIENTATION=+
MTSLWQQLAEVASEVILGTTQLPGENNEAAEAFPYNNLVPEDLLRDLAEKKRMKKLELKNPKKEISLSGVFPEIIVDTLLEKNL